MLWLVICMDMWFTRVVYLASNVLLIHVLQYAAVEQYILLAVKFKSWWCSLFPFFRMLLSQEDLVKYHVSPYGSLSWHAQLGANFGKVGEIIFLPKSARVKYHPLSSSNPVKLCTCCRNLWPTRKLWNARPFPQAASNLWQHPLTPRWRYHQIVAVTEIRLINVLEPFLVMSMLLVSLVIHFVASTLLITCLLFLGFLDHLQIPGFWRGDASLLQVWNFVTCQEDRALNGHARDVLSCDWHPSSVSHFFYVNLQAALRFICTTIT